MYKSMKDFKENADGEMEVDGATGDDGDDLAVTGEQIQTIDPYTKKEFVDPVKNKLCGHPYEKETIFELIRDKKKKHENIQTISDFKMMYLPGESFLLLQKSTDWNIQKPHFQMDRWYI